MKWFKHFSDASDSIFLQEAENRFGDAGYTVWFKILELIAKENGSELTGRLEISETVLCQKLRKRSVKVELLLNFYATSTSLTFSKINQKYIIVVPKLLELKDNYQKDLQVSGKKLSIEEELRAKKKNLEEEKKDIGASRPSSRGTRIPDDFQLNGENREIATKTGLNGNIDFVFAKFRSYWEGVSGSKGTKINWTSTWRNWCLNEAEKQGSKGQSHPNRNDGSPVDNSQKWKDYKSMNREDYLNKYPEDRKYAN